MLQPAESSKSLVFFSCKNTICLKTKPTARGKPLIGAGASLAIAHSPPLSLPRHACVSETRARAKLMVTDCVRAGPRRSPALASLGDCL